MLGWRRQSIILGICGTIVSGGPASAADTASWQPRRPVTIVVASGPGGGQDLVARAVQFVAEKDKLSKQPISVSNRPGGSGTVAMAFINSHPGDGGYVSVQALPLVTNQITGMSTMGVGDITPLAVLMTEPGIFSVGMNSPLKSGQDVIGALRKDPKSLTIGVSSSPGAQSQDAMALVAKAGGIDPKALKIIFFDSGGEAVTALMGGHVDLTVTPAGTVLGPSQAGKLRMIAVPAAIREGGPLANVPTWKEQGINVEFTIWRVLVGPKTMTAAQVKWWDDLLAQVTASPDWKEAAKRNLWTENYKNSAETRAFLAGEQARLAPLLDELGLAKKS